jgi:hypothetical protein
MMREIAVLFARKDSIYKSLPGCDVWDADRNALSWPGGAPIVAHPPCRAWGSFRSHAKPARGEKELAVWAVQQIRLHGGVLEHPFKSTLWPAAGLPAPGVVDSFGGYTVNVLQWWFGHRAAKATSLYICKVKPSDLPEVHLSLGSPEFVLATSKRGPARRPEISRPEREATPVRFALWLCEVARMAA